MSFSLTNVFFSDQCLLLDTDDDEENVASTSQARKGDALRQSGIGIVERSTSLADSCVQTGEYVTGLCIIIIIRVFIHHQNKTCITKPRTLISQSQDSIE